MRKALLGIAVATALFAVGAFAASFIVQSEDVASGADSVVACAVNVDIDFSAPELNIDGDWVVTGATATFYDSVVSSPASACNGFAAQRAVEVDGASDSYDGTTVALGKSTFDLGDGVLVELLTEASVAVDGKFIPA
jgi:hypothetical protein